MYNLFLDDIREPPDDGKEWFIVRSYDEAIQLMSDMGAPKLISFDHDLGMASTLTGKDVANWIVDTDIETGFLRDDFEFRVHSANPVGAENIRELLNDYLEFRRENR